MLSFAVLKEIFIPDRAEAESLPELLVISSSNMAIRSAVSSRFFNEFVSIGSQK
jgi:hypothetical protein